MFQRRWQGPMFLAEHSLFLPGSEDVQSARERGFAARLRERLPIRQARTRCPRFPENLVLAGCCLQVWEISAC